MVARHAPQSTVDQDLWLFDVSRDANLRRVTSEPSLEFWPIWVTNDRFIFGSGGGEPGIYERTVGGERQLVFKTDVGSEMPTSVTPDSQVLLYSRPGTRLRSEVWVRTSDPPSVRPLIQREFDQWQAQLSPNRRWVAYVSNEAGPNEVFVTEFRLGGTADAPTVGDSHPVSASGGFAPRWRADGRELFYLTPDGSVMAVDMKPDDALQGGAPRRLFQVPGVVPEWGVTKDGSRFLFAVPVTPRPPFDVIQNWQHALR
jgi:Tol biopolymer transport system component